MADEELESLLELLGTAVERIGAIRDPKQRAIDANRLAEAVHEVNVTIGVVRQDAVREIKDTAEARGELWQHRDTARLLGITVEKAGRIANTKLKRDEPGE